MRQLGVSADNPTFTVCGEEVVAMHDVSHLFKCIKKKRLLQARYNCRRRDSILEAHPAILHAAQHKKKLRAAPKLCSVYIHPGSFKKMKVKYDLQVLGRSWAGGIDFYGENGKRRNGSTSFLSELYHQI